MQIQLYFFLLKIWQHLSKLENLKEESLPLLITTTSYMLDMEAWRNPSIGDALQKTTKKTEISYKPWNGSSLLLKDLRLLQGRSTYNKLQMS